MLDASPRTSRGCETMNDLLCALLAAPPVLVLALLLYAVID